ncbi:thioredoxin TrxC [Glaciecola sp. SC05]|uniref:thioredoxin TrxC n=1 Tax=Glaciecola sp. SC05 TaxID=1987355 RepID=UPI003527A14D
MHIVCAACDTTNRIPPEKKLSDAKCGRCGMAVYEHAPIELGEANFFNYIEKNDLPIIVDFWADWCGPCNAMAPAFRSVAQDSEGLLFAKVDTQASQQIATEAGIRSLPTLIFFHKGEEIDRVSGALRESQIKQWIMQCISKL